MVQTKRIIGGALAGLVVAVASPVGVLGFVGGTADAAQPKVDATSYTVTCSGFTGSVKLSHAQTTAGSPSPSPQTDTLKGSLSGCTVGHGSGTPVSVTGASLKGALTNPSSYHKCGSASSAPVTVTGSVTIAWKATPKLTATSSVIAGSSATLSVDTSDNSVDFTVDGASATGPFEGSNSGASDVIAGSTGPNTLAGLATSCASKKGLKGLNLVSPPSGEAATLG